MKEFQLGAKVVVHFLTGTQKGEIFHYYYGDGKERTGVVIDGRHYSEKDLRGLVVELDSETVIDEVLESVAYTLHQELDKKCKKNLYLCSNCPLDNFCSAIGNSDCDGAYLHDDAVESIKENLKDRLIDK